jgi:hypothetical protein
MMDVTVFAVRPNPTLKPVSREIVWIKFTGFHKAGFMKNARGVFHAERGFAGFRF